MTEHSLCPDVRGSLEQLELGGDTRDYGVHFAGAGHLQPVGPQVVIRARIEERFEAIDHVIQAGHPREATRVGAGFLPRRFWVDKPSRGTRERSWR